MNHLARFPVVKFPGSHTDAQQSVLAATRRRFLLSVLSDELLPLPLDELATTVAEYETESRPLPPAVVATVRLALRYRHLPALATLGLVAYDPVSNQVYNPADRPIAD